ncbi:Ig-like domain-containing protein [Bifidobacterium parmae]|nr:Ig-like domain-containing protein [Bifidobacterium parmae]
MQWMGSSGYEYDASNYLSDFKAYVAKVNELGKKYTVTFDSNGGSAVATQTVDSGSVATSPTAPTRSGYTFGGWYSDAKLTTKYDFNSGVTGNITLYAKWDPITITSLDDATAVSTPAGVAPTLPAQVTAHYSDGSEQPVDVTWDSIAPNKYATAGKRFTVNGTVSGTAIKAKVTVNVTDAVPTGAVAAQSSVSTIATHAPDLSQVKATVTYSDGATQQADVTWDAVTPDQYASENANGFDVNGTVAVGDKSFTVTVKVIVTARTIASVTAPADQTVDSGNEPTYPDTVDVTYNDGETGTANVTWTKLTKAEYGKRAGGEFTVNGTVDGYAKGVSFKVTVKPATVQSVEPSATTAQTVVDQTPDLSSITATVTYSNGDTETAGIDWPQLTKDQFKTVGDRVQVTGSVTVDDTKHDVTVTVTVVNATVTKVESPQLAAGADANVTVDSGTSPETALNALKATVTWSNSTTTQESVTWDEPNKADYTNRKGGTFPVNGTVTIAGTDYPVKATYKVNPATAQKAELADGTTTVTVDSGTDPTGELPKTATVTWSNGDTTTSPITWVTTSYTKDDYAKREGGSFTVKGKATGLDVTVTVKVNPATVTVHTEPVTIGTTVGVQPNLPDHTTAEWSNGETDTIAVTWPAIAADKLDTTGSFELESNPFTVDGKDYTIKATVTVTAATVQSVDRDVKVTTTAGKAPVLPKTVKAHWSDGSTTDAAVTWNDVPAAKYAKAGTFSVKGVATVNGTDYEVTATVTVTSGDKLVQTPSNNTNANNTLTTTGSSVAIIAVIVVLLVIAAVALFVLTKRKKQ